MGPGDSHVQSDFASWIVGDGAWVVVMRPDLGVVLELRNLIDFVFRFDIAMFRYPQINTHSVASHILPVETGIRHSFVRTIYGDGTRPCPAPDVFAFLIAGLVKVANSRQNRSHVAGFVIHHARLSVQQILAKLS